jgi:hypothetical protein
MDFNFDVNIDDMDYRVFVYGYIFSRQAPVCDNPSSVNYSDCGDFAEFEDVIICPILHKDDKELICTPVPDDSCLYKDQRIIDKICEYGEK